MHCIYMYHHTLIIVHALSVDGYSVCVLAHMHIHCRHILGQFSWLAVHSLAEAAEAASAPVRIGVSKPLGASSVLPEYQGQGVQ